MTKATRLLRIVLTLVGAFVGFVVGLVLFRSVPQTAFGTVDVLLVLASTAVVARIAARIGAAAFPDYNVAEVGVEGPIRRSAGGSVPSGPTGATADEVVEQMERAADDRSVEAMLVKLNTPGGEVVPSDDIRLAAERFDGPTVAYSTDVCASGGYWIASGCDELWARDGTLVGSIGVRLGNLNVKELGDRLGVSYDELTAGEYKDAGSPFTEFTEDDRAYLQGLVDEWYDEFVDVVADGREMDATTIRETEARVYLGKEALELGLVDDLGTGEAVEDRVADLLGTPVTVEEFEPRRGLRTRLRTGATQVAYAVGAGFGSVVSNADEVDFRL